MYHMATSSAIYQQQVNCMLRRLVGQMNMVLIYQYTNQRPNVWIMSTHKSVIYTDFSKSFE